MSRIKREEKTVAAMIELYCRGSHGGSRGLCAECRELRDYAGLRLARCRFKEGKTTCGNCRVHCYKPEMRDRIRRVMRYAGPRMVFRHPVMAARHVVDSRRKAPFTSS